MKNNDVKSVTLNYEQAKELFDELAETSLESEKQIILRGAVNLHIHLAELLQDRSIKIKDIREIFGVSLEDKKTTDDDENDTGSPDLDEEPSPTDEKTAPEPSNSESEPDKPKKSKKTGGRVSHKAYTGLKNVQVPSSYQLGQRCPLCERGNLNYHDDMVLVRLDASLGSKLHVEQFRCGACQQIYTADYSSKYGEDKYNTVFKSKVVIDKYWSGMPFKRSETYYEMLGCPISDSTLWYLVSSVSDAVEPVYNEIVKYASDSDVISTDDTQVRILDRIKELKNNDEKRRGTYTTGFVCTRLAIDTPDIVLYMNGKKHMGENLDDLLTYRTEPTSALTVMTDGLDNLLSAAIEAITCNCMSHGFRKFKDILDSFPTECHHILKELKKVFVFDAECKKLDMRPTERLSYHQSNSLPIMNELKTWMKKQIDDHLVEPNSTLGKSINYMLSRWVKLTRFCFIEGAPLDNNEVERILKIAIRSRKEAMFYKTEESAKVGGMITTVIETCRRNHINPLRYITFIQDNVLKVINNPKNYLPWKFIDGSTIEPLSS